MILPMIWRNLISPVSKPQAAIIPPPPRQPVEVGTWYCRMGLKHCWQVKDREVRQAFDSLSLDIAKCLASLEVPGDDKLRWSVYMVGRRSSDAVPTILFCCKDVEKRKLARQLVEENRVLEGCKTHRFSIGDCSRSPDLLRVPSLPETLQQLAGSGELVNSISSNAISSDLCLAKVLAESRFIRPGMRVYYQPTGGAPPKFATVGSIYRHESKCYAITVEHIIHEDHELPPQSTPSEDDFEFDLADDPVSSSPLSKEGSQQLVNSVPDCVHEPANDTPYTPEDVSPQLSVNRPQVDKAAEVPTTSVSFAAREKIEIGRVVLSSSLVGHGALDFVLIELNDEVADAATHVRSTPTHGTPDVGFLGKTFARPEDAGVVAVTASAGALKGELSGTTSYVQVGQDHAYQEVWTVRFKGRLAKGDCGSSVKDVRTGYLYGYIVAGCPLNGAAYIIPAYKIHEHIIRFSRKASQASLTLSDALDLQHVSEEQEKPHIMEENPDTYQTRLDFAPTPRRTTEEGLNDMDWTRILPMIDDDMFEADGGFSSWTIFVVAACGFFTDSYNFMATNMIVPTIAAIYWSDRTGQNPAYLLNIAALCGTLIGQLLFGILADRYGHRKVYYAQIPIVIFATLGLATTSQSTGSLSILFWLCLWRFFMGIGAGSEYPLSAVVAAAHCSPRHVRSILGAIFAMQPLGQVAGLVVTTFLPQWLSRQPQILQEQWTHDKAIKAIDMTWRWVVGLGTLPAIVALLLRLALPSPGRHYRHQVSGRLSSGSAHMKVSASSERQDREHRITLYSDIEQSRLSSQENQRPWLNIVEAGKRVIWNDGSWKLLAAASVCWFLLDFAYYGVGLNSPNTLSIIWQDNPPITNPVPNTTLRLRNNTTQDGIVLDRGVEALMGNRPHDAGWWIVFAALGTAAVLSIPFRRLVTRSTLQTGGFLIMSLLLLITGFAGFACWRTSMPWLDGVSGPLLLVGSQILFNLGPNMLAITMIPPHALPARYRATIYGMIAGTGTLGAIAAQIFFITRPALDSPTANPVTRAASAMDWSLTFIAGLMVFGAFVTWNWLPDMPTWRAASTLEDLARAHSRKQYSSRGSLESEHCATTKRQLYFPSVAVAGA